MRQPFFFLQRRILVMKTHKCVAQLMRSEIAIYITISSLFGDQLLRVLLVHGPDHLAKSFK